MIPLLGGSGAALCFAASALCASAASRAIGAASTLAWVMGLGLVLIALPAALLAPPSELSAKTLTLLAIAGVTNVAGLGIEYVAMRRGKVGVVAAIASTEGVIAAAIAVLAGVHLGLGTAAVLAVVAVGVVLAAAHEDSATEPGSGIGAAALTVPVALLFGVTLYSMGRVGRDVSVLWVLVPARLVGVAFITVPLGLRGSLRLTRRAFPLVLGAGAAEVVGILSYTLGARHGLPVAAVLASQFAALVALGAFFLFGERLSRVQIAGLAVIAVGVGLLAAGQA
jgi:drug/metabolite transporter (DMT)-like permease